MSKLLLISFEGDEAVQLAGFAKALGFGFDVLVVSGSGSTGIGANLVKNGGLSEVPTADSLAPGLAPHVSGYTHIAAVSSMRSKDVLARLAGILDCPMVTDVISVVSPTVFKRPMVAGSVIATVEVLGEPVLMTVRPAGFEKVEQAGTSESESVEIELADGSKRTAVSAKSGAARPDLSQAKIVVSGGRPLGDADTFEKVIGGLADKLGGAVGATRAAVDSGIASNDLQVGQTGKIVAPDLYIAAGISGSTQHMAGIKDSKIIVAINKDPDAPIFAFADFGLVADLFDAVPELTSKV